MPHERSAEWWRRQTFSLHGVKLGWGSEYWDPKPENYEGASALRDRLLLLGRRPTEQDVALRLANSLLSDVLVAAGGIERTIFRLRQTAEELKDFADQHGVRGTAELPQKGLADFASIDAAYAFADLLSWVRNLDERLDRRAFEKGVKRRQGLLPALQLLRLRKHVQHAVDAFRAGPGGDSRDLANFTLHTALVRNPLSGVEVDQAGQICLPIPDTPGHPIYHWDLLSWKGRRDGFVFAEEVWEAVQILVDELLGAFEKAVPKRLRS